MQAEEARRLKRLRLQGMRGKIKFIKAPFGETIMRTRQKAKSILECDQDPDRMGVAEFRMMALYLVSDVQSILEHLETMGIIAVNTGGR
jgi:hypothetical protein